jgi:hypothetical protein
MRCRPTRTHAGPPSLSQSAGPNGDPRTSLTRAPA